MTDQDAADVFADAVSRNGGHLSLGHYDGPCVILQPPEVDADSRAGRYRSQKTAVVGLLRQHLPDPPPPGTRGDLQYPAGAPAWACQVADGGTAEDKLTIEVTLRTA